MKINIVGCGLSGITAAIILKAKGHKVEIFETRNHIGGNCYDKEMHGIKVHMYGVHAFHTNDIEVWRFLNRYTKFNSHTLMVRAKTKLGLLTIPYGKCTEEEIGDCLTDEEIFELIFKNYSERHWGISWDQLPRSISSRVPTRRNSRDRRYSTDKYQGIPSDGYTVMMKNMLDGIKVNVGVAKNDFKKLNCDKLIYTGKPDEFYDYAFGRLPYRSLRFEHFKGLRSNSYSRDLGAQINECGNACIKFNRTVDNSVFLNQKKNHTVYTRDYPEEHTELNDPFYPKNFGDGLEVFAKYKKAIRSDKNVIFLGRLGTYKYLDMWMAIKQTMVYLKNF